MDRIVVELKGGLGNQLFQLAQALEVTGGDLNQFVLEVSYFDRDARHGGYLLDRFFPRLKLPILNDATASRQMVKIDLSADPSLYLDRHALERFKSRGNVYLSGYFQNIELVGPLLASLHNLFWSTRIDCDSFGLKGFFKSKGVSLSPETFIIGVHIRRGDYLSADSRRVHGLVSTEAQTEVLKRLALSYPTAKIVVFSDDKSIQVSERLYKFEASIEQDKIGRDIDEFIAMAECNALICANSTFSLWAAYLSKSCDEVFLPTRWTINDSIKSRQLFGLADHRFRLYEAKLV
jgi:hypothetical protein